MHLLTDEMICAQALKMLSGFAALPKQASVTVPQDTRDLTMPLSDYAEKVLVPVVEGLRDGRLDHPGKKMKFYGRAYAEYDGIGLGIYEWYDIGADATLLHFAMTVAHDRS